MKNIQFLVDAAILHELGERLIGRPAIALGELVKNSFDADASICQIQFGRDEIVVYPDDSPSGTRITLKTLKNEWDEAAIRDLGNDVWLLRSPFNRPSDDA